MRVKTLKNSDKALDQNKLESLALRYVERYATTRHKLKAYLQRKIREKGWKTEQLPDLDALADRFSDLGYVDDAHFAENRAAGLARRGYGERRIVLALHQAGIAEEDRHSAMEIIDLERWKAADRFARRKSIGPYAKEEYSRDKCQRLLQAFLRAGHSYEIATKFVFAKPGEWIDQSP